MLAVPALALAGQWPLVSGLVVAERVGRGIRKPTVEAMMDPYARPKERDVGAHRPKIRHVSQSVKPRTRRERQAEKEAVAAERRAIKKAARRHLKKQMMRELDENE
jgi:hypothetical protein